MPKRVTYKELADVLESLGYQRTDVKGSRRIFDHKTVDSLIVLPYRRMNEVVDDTRLAIVRALLVKNGVVNEDVEDVLLRPVGR
jgi:predicted RNA binding protein YcfA (HicA-like mRNA interferase family)